MGWIYQFHSQKKILRTKQERFFNKCIYELSLGYMIKNNFLTPPIKIDSPVACYDFKSLKLNGKAFVTSEIERVLKDQKRITPVIIENIIAMAHDRYGVMIFTSSIKHAEEILRSLPPFISAMVIGDTESEEREEIIEAFKNRKLKFLVNVSVLTTGFDAPHVDVIAILRPTESVSLYQQIIGRGLRLSPNKTDCLVLDYTGQGHNIFAPEITEDKPTSDSVQVEITCPACGLINDFWGIKDETGEILEHFGRKCQGAFENSITLKIEECGFRFRFKRCDQCEQENDIAARICNHCQNLLVDNDKKLKEAMTLKDAHVMRVDSMFFSKSKDKKGNERLEVSYYDADAECLKEYFYLNSAEYIKAFYFNFTRMHSRLPEKEIKIKDPDDVISMQNKFRSPMFVIARKTNFFWEVREKVFLDN
jgi:DNA repair protein RadD